MAKKVRQKPTIGWREWAAMPAFGVEAIKAKIDTGARTSALHAYGLKTKSVDDHTIAFFEIHPIQRSAAKPVAVEVPISGWRTVTSSNGVSESRPFIVTPITIGALTWDIEVTLARRDEMGFRLLLGRQAVRRRFLIDPGRSFLTPRSPKED
ncbi:MAG: hypothetical protein HKN07_04810 [Acidimicrobiia bacterium]|nr:RimK/LysX family protein [Acidimicrobiia bacterium]NNF63560.1 hypothetical protein [Acidimicrobiia bacterium]